MYVFCIDSSRLPYGGFSKLTGGGGPQRFTISLVPYTQDLLPTASTWFVSLIIILYAKFYV